MKKTIIASLFVLLCVTSCDFLNEVPQDRLSPESYFKTETDLQLFTNPLYNNLLDKLAYEEQSDHCVEINLTKELHGGTFRTVNNGVGWNWGNLRRINTFLAYSSNCQDEAAVAHYNAVARFFRAFFYFEKVKAFGNVPWVEVELGSEDEQLYAPRDSREFVMQKMIEDIDYAIANLPASVSTFRVNKWAALALKAEFCLYEGTFRKYHAGTNVLATLPADAQPYTYYLQLAADAAAEIMNTSGYTLYKGNAKNTCYRDLFLGDPETGNAWADEVILARDYNATLSILHNSTYFTIGNYGNPSMTRKMACSYLMADGSRYTEQSGWETKEFKDELKNRDPRMSQTIRGLDYKRVDGTDIQAPSFANTITGYQPVKYMLSVNAGADTYNKSYQDLHIFRYAEILLIYAEAKAELGTLDQNDIDKSIKLLRDRVGMPNLNMAEANANPCAYLSAAETGYPNVTGSNKGVILEIRRERMVEMFDENKRWYDILRWRNGQAFTHDILGIYVPGPGIYDLNGDGKNDVHFYKNGESASTEAGVVGRKIDSDVFLSDNGKWNEERDYLYPLPVLEMQLNEALTQNPEWK